MIFRPSRKRHGEDRWLRHRMLIFLVGGALCLTGLVLETGLLINAAIAILAIGAALGIASRRQADGDDGSHDDTALD